MLFYANMGNFFMSGDFYQPNEGKKLLTALTTGQFDRIAPLFQFAF